MAGVDQDRKSTRLNSSHANISYAVFCLKKKKKNTIQWKRAKIKQDILNTQSNRRALDDFSHGVCLASVLIVSLVVFFFFFFFFFKETAPPRNLPFSPPRPSPD